MQSPQTAFGNDRDRDVSLRQCLFTVEVDDSGIAEVEGRLAP